MFPAVEVQRPRAIAYTSERPSERPTAPTLPPAPPFDSSDSLVYPAEDGGAPVVYPAEDGGAPVVELSTSALESLRDVEPDPLVTAIKAVPRWLVPVAVGRRMLGWGAFAVLAIAALGGDSVPGAVRVPNAVTADRQVLVYARPEITPVTPAGGCATAGPARVVASRARLAPGVDVSVVEGGFGLGFAATSSEASGVVVAGPMLHVAERVRLRGAGEVTRVAIDAGSDDLGVRVDGAISAGGAPVRVVAYAGWIQAMQEGQPAKLLWPVPGVTALRAGFVHLGRSRTPPPAPPEILRAVPRDDGGAIVVLKRSGALWVGSLDGSFAAEGPLVTIARPGATLGTPSVAAAGGGAIVAWAERATGASSFEVHVATVTAEDGARERAIARGMSPSVTALPDGELLLAWTSGASGAHRVVVQRLGRDLEARGEAVTVSPEDLNAGQPAAAVRADGRGVVAFFAAGGQRAGDGSLLAAPLACDPGL